MDLRPTVEARSDASPPTTTTHHGTALLSQPRSSETDCPAYHSPLPSSPPLSIVRPGPGGSPRFETSSATRTVAGIWQQQQRWIALLAPPPPPCPGPFVSRQWHACAPSVGLRLSLFFCSGLADPGFRPITSTPSSNPEAPGRPCMSIRGGEATAEGGRASLSRSSFDIRLLSSARHSSFLLF